MKTSKGFTLLEALIALGVWMVLSLSVVLIWQHTARRSYELIARQDAFENARFAMDALINNIQVARTIVLRVDGNYVLQDVLLTGYRWVIVGSSGEWRLHTYEFLFDINAGPGNIQHHRLQIAGNMEFASNIASVRMIPVGEPGDWRYMRIAIRTGCDPPIELEGSVDIRFKSLTVLR